MRVHLVHIYPSEMNIYGDTGNVLILRRRLEWRGYELVVHRVGVGDQIPSETDIIIGGGGQDSGQLLVTQDLAKKSTTLHKMFEEDVTMLMICGMYQLFGHYFLPQNGEKLRGIGIFDLVTEASDTRLIGNIVSSTPFGKLIGYENHSGLTWLGGDQLPLGKTKKNQGNNGKDATEGAIAKNAFGSYLHGPILAKNPDFADELIKKALSRKKGAIVRLAELDNKIEQSARAIAVRRNR